MEAPGARTCLPWTFPRGDPRGSTACPGTTRLAAPKPRRPAEHRLPLGAGGGPRLSLVRPRPADGRRRARGRRATPSLCHRWGAKRPRARPIDRRRLPACLVSALPNARTTQSAPLLAGRNPSPLEITCEREGVIMSIRLPRGSLVYSLSQPVGRTFVRLWIGRSKLGISGCNRSSRRVDEGHRAAARGTLASWTTLGVPSGCPQARGSYGIFSSFAVL
ncbi:hypothetical protein ES708_14030 [subsurface metagenome]